MATGNFDRCHAVTARWEGGWSDHPADPGGKTMYGVTEAVYHAWLRRQGKPIRPVRNIAMAEALAIYKAEYWHAAGCETLAVGVDLATYDAAVNSGPGRARKWLLKSIGGPDVQTIKRICAARLSFVRALSTWATFGRGWLNRITDIEAKAVAWSTAATAASKSEVRQVLSNEAEDAKKKSSAQAAGGTASGGGTLLSPEAADQVAGVVLGGIITLAIAVTAFLVFRAIINKRRADSYTKEAEAL